MDCPNSSKLRSGFFFNKAVVLIICSSLLKTSPEVVRPKWTRFSNQLPRGIYFSPHVPQYYAAHTAVLQVVDDALPVGLLPIRKGFVTPLQLEHIRVKRRQVMIRFGPTRHVPSR